MAFALHNGDTAKPRAYSRRRHSVATGTKRGKSLRFCEHPVPTSGLEYSAARDPDKVLFRGIPYPCAMSHGPQIREVDVARDTDQVPSLFQPPEHISGTPGQQHGLHVVGSVNPAPPFSIQRIVFEYIFESVIPPTPCCKKPAPVKRLQSS